MWRSGDGPLAAGAQVTNDGRAPVPHFAEPVTVVRDDPDALVAWLAAGTPVLQVARADGLGKRDDKSTLFTAETVQDIGVHAWYDILRIAPTGRPWSVWVFFAEHTGEFAGWYVNLEDPHSRDDHAVYTRDHVLDLEIEPDRTRSGVMRGSGRQAQLPDSVVADRSAPRSTLGVRCDSRIGT